MVGRKIQAYTIAPSRDAIVGAEAGMTKRLVYQVAEEEEALRLDRWISRKFPHIANGTLHKFLRQGDIRVEG